MTRNLYDKDYFDAHTRVSLPHVREVIYPLAERTARLLCNRLRPRRALDIGCAKGFLVEALLAAGVPSAFGTDISLYVVFASDPAVRHRLVAADALAGIPFRSSSFDLVTAVDVFEHLPDPDAALREISRVLTRDGFAYLKICHPRHPNARRDPTHVNVQPLAYWQSRFARTGFDWTRVYEADFRPRRHLKDIIKALIVRGIEWAAIGVPADYKFLLRASRHG